jgi:hypothetical protein
LGKIFIKIAGEGFPAEDWRLIGWPISVGGGEIHVKFGTLLYAKGVASCPDGGAIDLTALR